MQQSAAESGNVFVVAESNAKEVAELVVATAEPGRRSGALEAEHGPVSAFEAVVVLLQPVVEVAAGPGDHARSWKAVGVGCGLTG